MKKKVLPTYAMVVSFLFASVVLISCGQSGNGSTATDAASALSSGIGTAKSTISGVVKDIATGSAITGATVSSGSRNAVTDSSGAYSLGVAAGSNTLSVSAPGYLASSQTATVVSRATQTVNWALTKSYGNQKISPTSRSAATVSPEDTEHDDSDASSEQEPEIAPISEDD
jgi:Carboxypeptidase regulatory-like domain